MLKLLVVLAVIYAFVLALTYVNQSALIYQRSNRGLTAAETDALGLVKWPNDHEYRGYLVDVADADKTFVLFHGNAGEAANRLHYLPPFARQNARTLLVEYPGFGLRIGEPSEELLVADSVSILQQIANEFPDDAIFVFGESLGSGIASATLGEIFTNGNDNSSGLTEQIHGLGLITPFDSLVKVAQRRYWYLPVRWLIQDQYNNIEHLQHIGIPKALVLSGQDRVVPIQHGLNLEKQLPDIKKSFLLPDAGHSNWMDYVDHEWWDRYFAFLLQAQADQST